MKVLVTGGSRGIGKEIVNIYQNHGHEVCFPVRDELNLSNEESVNTFIECHKDDAFDVVVNNAGVNIIGKIEDTSLNALNEMVSVNLLSPYRLLMGMIPYMKRNHFGRIVNIGSIWGVISKPGRSVYSMTKHGIHGLTKTLALELAGDNILVNTVAPGQTLTELTIKNNSPEAIEFMKTEIPLGRLAEPCEIAKVVYWLGSEENTYITGQQLVVDGGLTIR